MEDTLSKVAMLSVGVDDTLAHYTAEEFAAGAATLAASVYPGRVICGQGISL